jgi:hypothetical protein
MIPRKTNKPTFREVLDKAYRDALMRLEESRLRLDYLQAKENAAATDLRQARATVAAQKALANALELLTMEYPLPPRA